MAGDSYWGNVVLAMHMDGANNGTTFTDAKGKTITPYGNAKTSTTQVKFGTTSAYFDGTGDYLTTPFSSDFVFDSGDFTVDFWVYPTATPGTWAAIISCNDDGNTNGWRVLFGGGSGSRVLHFAWYSSNAAYGINSSSSLTLNTWTHVAVTRSSGTVRFFFDGVAAGSAAVGAIDSQAPGNTPLVIGATNAGGSWPYEGYIDDLRVTKAARWTSAFTPPSSAFPNSALSVSGTVKDSSGALCARTVRLYRESDGALAGSATSDAGTGEWSISPLDGTAHFVVVHPSGSSENALIFNHVTPV